MAYETCKGYTYCKRYKTWRSKVKIDGVCYYLGSFSTEKLAGLAVDKKLIAMGKEPRNVLKRFKATGATQ